MPDGSCLAPVATSNSAPRVRAAVRGRVGVITLDRAEALNALTIEMVEAIDAVLQEWRLAGLRAVVLASTIPRVFCVGGDVRAIQMNSLAMDSAASERFFATEYRLNECIATYPVPIVSLIDGLCLGGGMGLSMHGVFRVVSGNATLAMPEAGIGFFPDVGASYFLSRLPGSLGVYLGLTGYRMSASDALFTGLATHYVDSAAIGSVPDVLVEYPQLSIDRALRDLATTIPNDGSVLAEHRHRIDWCFSGRSVADIDERLTAMGGNWANATRDTLHRQSRQSLDVTVELLAWGKQRTLRECLDAELLLTRDIIRTPDFIEGIRAALVDKDRNPRWETSRFIGLDGDGRPLWK